MNVNKNIDLKLKYPLDKLEIFFTNIEKLGYTVHATENCCQIYDNITLIIDADFHENDYHLNAAEAIEAFYN